MLATGGALHRCGSERRAHERGDQRREGRLAEACDDVEDGEQHQRQSVPPRGRVGTN